MQGYKVFYWRNGNDEIDFVLEKAGKSIGLEIISGATSKVSGMNSFNKQMQPDKVLLIGNNGLPCKEFLKIKPGELF